MHMISRSISILLYCTILTNLKQIPVPPELLDEMEELYAPSDHSVFTLVPPVFHECATDIYCSIGEPEVTVKTFWDVYCNILGRLREPMDDQLTDVLDTFQANHDNNTEDMALLPNMEPFHLGQPLNLDGRFNYIGGLEPESSVPLDFNRPGVEYALFTDSDNSSNDSEPDSI